MANEIQDSGIGNSSMFCYQCEQTAKGSGCTSFGVCGKSPETAALQDLLVYVTQGVSAYAHRARQLGVADGEVDAFVPEALFVTLTNVNFYSDRIEQYIRRGAQLRDKARRMYEKACRDAGKTPEKPTGPAAFTPPTDTADLLRAGEAVTIQKRLASLGADITGLQELVTYGLKGMAAYVYHAAELGQRDDSVYAYFHKAMDFLTRTQDHDAGSLVAEALEVGKVNLHVMALLDAANTGTYGHPEPTRVRVTPVRGKCILVSGHDLKDLDDVLKATQGLGINVYTHGEMLPCLAYPGLKKYKHLVGNYGGAWQEQRHDFEAFPGAILMTTNCIQKPKASYKARIFTTSVVGFDGVRHITDGNYAPLIEAALAQPGFDQDAEEKTITVGFGHNAVLGVADKVIEAVKAGKIRRFFLVGGCDGATPGRNYYTELAEQIPSDCVIMTLACGKFRFNKLEFGDIGGIPRLLDVGQCNDSYSAIRIAGELANAFGCEVNDLPLSLVLSWFEQKAVVILLTLLHLGIKNIRLGPSLPAFVTPPVLKVLVDNYNVMPVTTPEQDLAAILG